MDPIRLDPPDLHDVSLDGPRPAIRPTRLSVQGRVFRSYGFRTRELASRAKQVRIANLFIISFLVASVWIMLVLAVRSLPGPRSIRVGGDRDEVSIPFRGAVGPESSVQPRPLLTPR